MSTSEGAALWGISGRMINYYCVDGRMPSAQKVGATQIIPKDVPKPEDRRKGENRKNDSTGGHSNAKTKGV